MSRKPSLKSAKKAAWKACSEYVRLKHADDDGYCECYTCGKKIFWKTIKDGRKLLVQGIQAGHGVAGRSAAVLFNEDIIKPQCYGCNVMQAGRFDIFQHKLRQEIGHEKYELALFSKFQTVKRKPEDYVVMRAHYEQEVGKLLQEKAVNFKNPLNGEGGL